MNNKSFVPNLLSWVFGIVVFAIGVLNVFWGIDPGFGVFFGAAIIYLLSSGECHYRENDRFLHPQNIKNPFGHLPYLGILRCG